MSKSLSSQQSTPQRSTGHSRNNATNGVSNSERNSAVQAMNGAQKNPPSAKLPFKRAPMNGEIHLPGAVAYTTLTVAGTLTAKKVGSSNPMNVLFSGVSYGGENGEVEVGHDGSVGAEASTTLNGIKNSIQINLDGGKPTVGFGVAGSFGAHKVAAVGNKIIYSCETPEIQKVVNGVEISGKLSYTLEVTIIPKPPQKQPRSIWEKFTQVVSSAAQSIADFVYDNKEEILIGTVAVVAAVGVVAAIGATGGLLAPGLALTSDRRLKRNVKQVGISPSGIPTYTFQYLDHDSVYHGVMAQDLQSVAPEALVTREDGMFAVHYDLIDVDFYVVSELLS